MKVTKKQLKQIIREELSEQSFMDRLKGFFGGKKEEPEAPKEPEQSEEEKAAAEKEAKNEAVRAKMREISKNLTSAGKFISDTDLYKLGDAYQRANSYRYENTKGADDVKTYAVSFGIPLTGPYPSPPKSYRSHHGAREAIAKHIMKILSPGGKVYDDPDPVEAFKRLYRSMGNALETVDEFYGRTFSKDTRDELEARKRELDARFDVDDDSDQFLRRHENKKKTGSKITKEVIKQIIREEIKNVKGSK